MCIEQRWRRGCKQPQNVNPNAKQETPDQAPVFIWKNQLVAVSVRAVKKFLSFYPLPWGPHLSSPGKCFFLSLPLFLDLVVWYRPTQRLTFGSMHSDSPNPKLNREKKKKIDCMKIFNFFSPKQNFWNHSFHPPLPTPIFISQRCLKDHPVSSDNLSELSHQAPPQHWLTKHYIVIKNDHHYQQ